MNPPLNDQIESRIFFLGSTGLKPANLRAALQAASQKGKPATKPAKRYHCRLQRLDHAIFLNLLPECGGIQIIVLAEKIKDGTALLPGIAVPAVATRRTWFIDFEGWLCILSPSVVISKGTLPDTIFIQIDIV